ncbi:uncharacterized protein LOC123868963 [Maniola jurtina]|uniref:uncharacterized protein LOC123868963 n=1 Tax=Maniola jurtina TaxID=191418 RepID=UPI001E68D241|nr:uncharacterized protein LOC123868963 [Maniola jurtina]
MKLKRKCLSVIMFITTNHLYMDKALKGEPKFITLVGNKRVLMINGYTFARTTKRHWYCSKKAKGCKAKVTLDETETEVLVCDNVHNHEPPVYGQSAEGGTEVYNFSRQQKGAHDKRLYFREDNQKALVLFQKG